MKPPLINEIAVWLPMKRDELDIKIFPAYNYLEPSGLIKAASKDDPIIRYAKNYTRGRTKFSLCMITLQRDSKKVEKFMDKAAKDVEVNVKDRAFTRTGVMYDGK